MHLRYDTRVWAASQLEKIEMLEVANFIVINKFEKPRTEDALRDVRKQYRRNHKLFANHPGSPEDNELPIFGTMASKFNDNGVNALFREIALNFDSYKRASLKCDKASKAKKAIIPASQVNYLRDIGNL